MSQPDVVVVCSIHVVVFAVVLVVVVELVDDGMWQADVVYNTNVDTNDVNDDDDDEM